MSIANNLRNIRNDHGMSQTFVAKKLNITRQAYCNYETGFRTPPIDMLKSISKIYNVRVDVLIQDENNSAEIDDPTQPGKKEKASSVETEREKNLKYLSELIEKLDINDLAKVEDYMDLLISRHKK